MKSREGGGAGGGAQAFSIALIPDITEWPSFVTHNLVQTFIFKMPNLRQCGCLCQKVFHPRQRFKISSDIIHLSYVDTVCQKAART